MQYIGNQAVQAIGRTKQLIPFPYSDNQKSVNGLSLMSLSNGGIRMFGTATALTVFQVVSNQDISAVNLKDGVQYALSGGTPINLMLAHRDENNVMKYKPATNNPSIFTWNSAWTLHSIYYQIPANKTVDTVMYPMLNEGSTALPYQPYLQRYDMYLYNNLIKTPYVSRNTTYNGVTFTVDEETGWITANGTATAETGFWVKGTSFFRDLSKGTYVITDGGSAKNENAVMRFGSNIYLTDNMRYTFEPNQFQSIYIRILAGTTVNNLVFKPELLKLIGD
jgi:hypothetical protein